MAADTSLTADVGPGKYNTVNMKHLNPNEKQSWNTGEVPFGSGGKRFKIDWKANFKPGPGQYSPMDVTANIPNLFLKGNNVRSVNSISNSPQTQKLVEMNRTVNFKSL